MQLTTAGTRVFALSLVSSLHIGLDAGGSSTELLARASTGSLSSPKEETRLQGDGANPERSGHAEAVGTLAELVGEAVRRHPATQLRSVCAGVAGAGSGERRQALAGRLRRALGEVAPRARVRLVHDARIALEAAFGNASGTIIIAGTGSAVFARTEAGTLERAGGWGYILGDEGSGYALGRAGLRAVARALDGGPATRLQALLSNTYGANSRAALVGNVYEAELPLQEAAQAVLEAAAEGDAVAARILDEQTDALARQVAWLAEREATIAPQVVLFGGLTKNAHYVETLGRAVRGALSANCSVQPASCPPVAGALRLALREDPGREAASNAPEAPPVVSLCA